MGRRGGEEGWGGGGVLRQGWGGGGVLRQGGVVLRRRRGVEAGGSGVEAEEGC